MDLDAWPVADVTPMLHIPMARGLVAADWSFRLFAFNSRVMMLKQSDATYGRLMRANLLGAWTMPTQESHNGDQVFLVQLLEFDELPHIYNVGHPGKQRVAPQEAKVVHKDSATP